MGFHLLEPIKSGGSTPDRNWLSKWYGRARAALESRKHLVITCLSIVVLLILFFNGTPDGEVSEPIERRSQNGATGRALANGPSALRSDRTDAVFRERQLTTLEYLEQSPSTLALLPREEFSETPKLKFIESDLFAGKSWSPPRLPPTPKAIPAPPAPSAPQFPYTYLGKKFEDSVWEVYLARGDQTFIVRPQTLIEGSYRVESIKPPLVTLTYLPLNAMQTLLIEGTN